MGDKKRRWKIPPFLIYFSDCSRNHLLGWGFQQGGSLTRACHLEDAVSLASEACPRKTCSDLHVVCALLLHAVPRYLLRTHDNHQSNVLRCGNQFHDATQRLASTPY
jgi:hypothetical protein